MDHRIPERPDTDTRAAIEALEFLVISEFAMRLAERTDGLEIIEAARAGSLSGALKDGPLLEGHARSVAEHSDWLWAAIDHGARRMRELAAQSKTPQ